MTKILATILGGLILASSAALSLADDNIPADSLRLTGEKVIKVNPASKARIKFESDLFDFGSIPRGATVVHTFKFRNTGQDTLRITNVKPTCGCTTAPLSSNEIPPGGEANIRANFDSQKFNGRVTKQIYVDSSDPISPYLKVSFTAIINDPLLDIEASPAEVDFDTVGLNKAANARVTLTNASDKEVELAIVGESTPEAFKATLSRAKLGPKESTELAFTLAPQPIAGDFKESITFEYRGSETRRFTLPVRAFITE